MISDETQAPWRRFALNFAIAAAALTLMLFGFNVALDPFGIRASPTHAPTPLMDVNQRFMYPQVVRSGQFDSGVFGTSTIRLLDPKRLDRAFGSKFANFGMNAATPWEQLQLATLFIRQEPAPKVLIFGLDETWCEADADRKKLTFRTFPPWLYDDEPWKGYPELLNLTTLEIAGRVALHRLGLMRERLPPNGYEIFVPDEALYDLSRARENIRTMARARSETVVRPGTNGAGRGSSVPGAGLAGRSADEYASDSAGPAGLHARPRLPASAAGLGGRSTRDGVQGAGGGTGTEATTPPFSISASARL